MENKDNPLDTITGQISRELSEAKEKYLKDIWASTNLTLEEFARLYLVEEYPIEFVGGDDIFTSDYDNQITYTVAQKFRVRLKSPEELAEWDIKSQDLPTL